jgi:pilus assembly protein Flp/PilA
LVGRRSGWDGQDGATAVEYGIMVALIAVVIVLAVWGVGQALSSDYSCVQGHLENAPNDPNAVTGC